MEEQPRRTSEQATFELQEQVAALMTQIFEDDSIRKIIVKPIDSEEWSLHMPTLAKEASHLKDEKSELIRIDLVDSLHFPYEVYMRIGRAEIKIWYGGDGIEMEFPKSEGKHYIVERRVKSSSPDEKYMRLQCLKEIFEYALKVRRFDQYTNSQS